VNESEFRLWLERYGQAWKNRDPEAAAALFSEDARYYEIPFQAPAQGRDGVRQYWTGATRSQADITFSYDIVSVSGSRGIARWRATFRRVPSEVRVRLDGIFLLEFNNEGLCCELREWWHRAESEPRRV
jgi:uncharacterized protein (TIGR02246 family)